jgi:hypothetical protein
VTLSIGVTQALAFCLCASACSITISGLALVMIIAYRD